MKKFLFLVLTTTLLIGNGYSQKAKFGFMGGLTLGSQSTKSSGLKISGNSRAGFTLGVLADVNLSDNFSFQPSLNFTQKGGKYDFSDLGLPGSGKVDFVLNYIEVPLNVLFKANAGKGKFFFGAGPSLSFGMSGTVKSDNSPDEDVKFGSGDNDDLKPFDFGGNVLAGYELSSGVFIALNYNTTLNNIAIESDATTRNSYFGIRIGYLLGGKKK